VVLIGLLILVVGFLLITVASIPAVNNRLRGLLYTADSPNKLHYAWVILAILAVAETVAVSISLAEGIMVAPLIDPDGDFGWNIRLISGIIAFQYLIGAISAPITGWLGDRYGPRRLMVACGLLFGGGMLFLGVVSELWQLFLAFGCILALTTSIAFVTLQAAVGPWFKRRLGLAIGITQAAGGVGAAILAPVIGGLLETVGWRTTFWSIGIVGGGILLVIAIFFRNYPSDMGLKAYGTREDDPPVVVREPAMEELRLKVFNQAQRRTRAFWNLPLVHFLGCAGMGVILVYIVPIAVDQGFSLTTGAVILTIISLVSIVGRFITPVLAELYGPRNIMSASLAIQGLSVLILFVSQDLLAFYVFAAVFGLGFGGEWTGYLVINRRYFGDGPMGTCYGWQMSGALLGHAVITALSGLIIYATGSYTPVLVLSIATSLAGVVVILMLDSTSQVLIPDWEQSLPPEARSSPTVPLPAAD